MSITTPSKNKIASFLKSYGPSRIKKLLWEKEFSGGQWDFIDNTMGDCVYENLEKWARNGSILDLGCGPGNTANELDAKVYQHYVGIDISETALEKARKRTITNGREGKNIFVQSDFVTYTPLEKFDVILFRESIYHVPMSKIKDTLDRFSNYLKDGGVLMVRMFTADKDSGGKEKPRPAAMIKIMEDEFNVIEKNQYDDERHPTVIVLRPRRRT